MSLLVPLTPLLSLAVATNVRVETFTVDTSVLCISPITRRWRSTRSSSSIPRCLLVLTSLASTTFITTVTACFQQSLNCRRTISLPRMALLFYAWNYPGYKAPAVSLAVCKVRHFPHSTLTDCELMRKISQKCSKIVMSGVPPKSVQSQSCAIGDLDCICAQDSSLSNNKYFDSHCLLQECTNIEARKGELMAR
jgi:hypothetical protein